MSWFVAPTWQRIGALPRALSATQMAIANVARHTRQVVPKHYRISNPILGLPLAILFMKRQIDVRSENNMRFFTPELYLRFNSSDAEVADRANQEWEAAIKAYQKHLGSLSDRMPHQMQELCGLCLHDWELVAWNDAVEPDSRLADAPLPVWSAFSVLSLQRESEIISVNYVLWDKVQRFGAPANWPFSEARTYWMYDEVDVVSVKSGNYMHRILFSDGSTARIPFAVVFVNRIPGPQQVHCGLPAVASRRE